LILLILSISKSFGIDINNLNTKKGVIALMYHRFEENKYPSTNIKNEIFLEHLKEINNLGIEFITFEKFKKIIKTNIDKNYLLLTIDDAFESFYLNAWPILKNKRIPFVLFVSTREVGKHGYMTWKHIKEVAASDLVTIGNHSHTHEYLIDWEDSKIISDLETSIQIFKKELGYSPKFFSYPFGEYSNFIKDYISKKFKFSFGQHSGVIGVNKNFFELPRFPINEKYGNLERFKFLINLSPLPFKKLMPEEKYINIQNNPPEFFVEFFENQKNLKNINCFSDEGNKWEKSYTSFNNNILKIKFRDKFLFRRGRINCSLNDDGIWRWFGVQFSIEEN